MKKYYLSILTVGFTIAFVAFTTKEHQVWYFAGTSTADITDYTKYFWNASHESCSTTGNAPCDIWVPEAIDTQTELAEFFIGKTNTDIMDLAETKRQLED